MPYNRPLPIEILEIIQSELDIEMPGSDARLRRTVEATLARVMTIVTGMMFDHIDWTARQITPHEAEKEYLVMHGDTWGRGITRNPATVAKGNVTFTGSNGSIVQNGTILRRSDAVEYMLKADVVIAANTGTGLIAAQLPGIGGTAPAGLKLGLTSPIAGINSSPVVAAGGLTGGVDEETDGDMRIRILEAAAGEAQGGSVADYTRWAREVSGVTRAWVYPNQMGINTVVVLFVMDNKPVTIVPSATEIEQVRLRLTDENTKPTGAEVFVLAPQMVEVPFQIALKPNSIAIQNAVKAELTDLFRREGKPGGTIYLSRINESISAATGEFDHVLTQPTANVEMTFGKMPMLGAFTWSAL